MLRRGEGGGSNDEVLNLLNAPYKTKPKEVENVKPKRRQTSR